MASALVPAAFALAASAGNATFYVIFGLFVVAMLALVVIVIVWAVRHDMAGRAAWRERQLARTHEQPPPPEEQ